MNNKCEFKKKKKKITTQGHSTDLGVKIREL